VETIGIKGDSIGNAITQAVDGLRGILKFATPQTCYGQEALAQSLHTLTRNVIENLFSPRDPRNRRFMFLF
jgi:hypothetical protein